MRDITSYMPPAAEGLKLAKQARPDVITLDIIMPDLDGWSVLKALKADPDLCDIPVVLVTIMRDRDLGFALGAADYITKPLEREVLMRVVGRHVRGDGGAQVLVVDDDPKTRDMLRRTCRRQAARWPKPPTAPRPSKRSNAPSRPSSCWT